MNLNIKRSFYMNNYLITDVNESNENIFSSISGKETDIYVAVAVWILCYGLNAKIYVHERHYTRLAFDHNCMYCSAYSVDNTEVIRGNSHYVWDKYGTFVLEKLNEEYNLNLSSAEFRKKKLNIKHILKFMIDSDLPMRSKFFHEKTVVKFAKQLKDIEFGTIDEEVFDRIKIAFREYISNCGILSQIKKKLF